MREYKSSPFGYVVDLDDPATYTGLPQFTDELRTLMLSEIGYAYCYMNYWCKALFPDDNEQRVNVEKMIKEFTKNERYNHSNVLWYQEQLFLFRDEIENMV